MAAAPDTHLSPVRSASLALLTALAWSAALPPLARAETDEPATVLASEDGTVGIDVCRACHALETQHWRETIHADVFLKNPRTPLEARACEACHGPGAEHVKAPKDATKIVSFTRGGDRTSEDMNAACLQCHAGGARVHWAGSMHESQDLACSDCHDPMAKTSPTGLLREASVNATCFGCHPAQRVEFRKRSHMPLLEGKLDCADCHQPHGSANEPLLKHASTFDLCTSCHADKRGPFLWEHAPVTEDCTTCHVPHGSNRRSLLVTSPPFLCQQCHAQIGVANHPTELLTPENLASGAVPAARDARVIGRGCVTCHSQIHGSNHPSGVRFHR